MTSAAHDSIVNGGMIINIISAFIEQPVLHASQLSGGHLNETWRVTTASGTYICQCIRNHALLANRSVLRENHLACLRACDEADGAFLQASAAQAPPLLPRWLQTPKGHYFHIDDRGYAWRVYREIPGRTGQRNDDPYVLGAGLGCLHQTLSRIKMPLSCAIPGYRDLCAFLDQYDAMTGTKAERVRQADRHIEDLRALYAGLSLRAEQVIHGDTKPENFIIENGHIVGCIDLDTLMYGSRLMDIADALRSLHADEAMMERYLRGYDAASCRPLADVERRQLPAIIQSLYFELGVRYYTDYLRGGFYFADMTQEECLARALYNIEASLPVDDTRMCGA